MMQMQQWTHTIDYLHNTHSCALTPALASYMTHPNHKCATAALKVTTTNMLMHMTIRTKCTGHSQQSVHPPLQNYANSIQIHFGFS